MEEIKAKLKKRQYKYHQDENKMRKASVLIPLSQGEDNTIYVWFTMRSLTLRSNPGEVGNFKIFNLNLFCC